MKMLKWLLFILLFVFVMEPEGFPGFIIDGFAVALFAIVFAVLIKGYFFITTTDAAKEEKSSLVVPNQQLRVSRNTQSIYAILYPKAEESGNEIVIKGDGVKGRLHFTKYTIVFESFDNDCQNVLRFEPGVKTNVLKNGVCIEKSQNFYFVIPNSSEMNLVKSIIT